MKRLSQLILFVFLVVPFASHAQSNEADAILGVWLTATAEAKIQIYKCGSEYCGKIAWMKEPLEEDGSRKVDNENPDESKRNRPILGLEILTQFEYDEDLEWEDGEIYDPESGKTYSCIITLEEDRKTLNVRGYIGFSLIGRTEVWTKSSL